MKRWEPLHTDLQLYKARNESLTRQNMRLAKENSRLRDKLREFRKEFLINQRQWVGGHAREIPAPLEPFRKNLGEFAEFQRVSCVYFLLLANEIVYVGKSVDLPSRIQSHMENILFDRVFFLRAEEDQLDRIETAFIRYLKPKMNRSLGIKMPDIYEVLKELGLQEET